MLNWRLKANNSLNGKFIFILYWLYVKKRLNVKVNHLININKIKVLLKQSRIPKIANVQYLYDLTDLKMITFFILISLHNIKSVCTVCYIYWFIHFKMLENHWACFLTQFEICRRTRNWIGLNRIEDKDKTFLKVLNKAIILKYPLKTNRTNQSSEEYLEPSWTSTIELFLARKLHRIYLIGFWIRLWRWYSRVKFYSLDMQALNNIHTSL